MKLFKFIFDFRARHVNIYAFYYGMFLGIALFIAISLILGILSSKWVFSGLISAIASIIYFRQLPLKIK
mgnify:CR=1 FL=1